MWYLVGIHPALRTGALSRDNLKPRTLVRSQRLPHLDTLRTFLTTLVIYHHTAIIYGGEGNWNYIEATRRNAALTMFAGTNQTWFMGAFFLVSGFLSASSLQRGISSANRAGRPRRQVIWAFAKGRLLRLGLPAVVFTLFIQPLVSAIAQELPMSWDTYISYLSNLRGVQGSAWWLATALLFDSTYAAYVALDLPTLHVSRYTPPVAAASLPIFAFFWQYIYPIGTHIRLLHLHAAYAPQYVLAYTAGVWLRSEPQLITSGMLPSKSRWRTSPLPALGLWVGYTVALLSLPIMREVLRDPKPLYQGGNIQTFGFTIWHHLGFFALTHSAIRVTELLTSEKQPDKNRPGTLSRLAYGAFLAHVLILTTVAVNLRSVELPPVTKTVVVGTVSTVLSFLASAVLNRIPWIAAVI